MAATPFDPSHPATNFFDIYNDATAPARGAMSPTLPCGGCNFVDLTPGANGAKCGCRRFWVRQAPGSPVMDQSGWCMCNHHACFHDQGFRDRDGPPAEVNIPNPGQENERPRTGREPLSPVIGISLKTPPAVPGMEFSSFGPGPLSFIHDMPQEENRQSGGLVTQAKPPGSMPDTLAWGDVFQSPTPASANMLPPIPSQCLLPSQTASTTSSYQAKYLRPFAGKGLQTLSGATGVKPRGPTEQPKELVSVAEEHARQVETFEFVDHGDEDEAASRPGTATQTEPRAAAASSDVKPEMIRQLADAVGDHGQRLDKLETVSFHDDWHERWDNMDVRMTELETRVEEVEKFSNDNASVVHVRRGRDEDAATQSMVSVSTSTTGKSAVHSQDVMSQIQSLQAQVTHLQSYLPSPNYAWEVEVVFLPFPLKRLWQPIHQFKPESATLSNDDWTQLPMTHSTMTRRSQSPFPNDWAAAEHDAEWLLPRACGNTSVVDKRLRSRGLIQKVAVRAPDHRSVQTAVQSAFGNVFREMQMRPRMHSTDPRFVRLLGLQQNWVPLRKIHKDSRLRFLSPAEMMTPSLWDVQFLNSVMMRSSEPRLFITHPNAYLQDIQAYETGWTWQRVRELNRVYQDVTESQEVPEADAMEEHWSWSEQLDEPPSAHTSMSMRQERARASMSPLIVHNHSWRRSMSPAVERIQSPMPMLRRDSLPPHIRTTSLPVAAQARSSPTVDKRRVASYGQSRRSTPSVRAMSQAGVMKRRRTRSPSHHRFTPRWTASPSPMPQGLSDRQVPRGTTPFAYATPYSNAPLQELRPVRSSSVARTATEYLPEYDNPLAHIDIYESASDESYVDGDEEEEDESVTSEDIVTHVPPLGDSQQWQLPEDEPWPGIEDRARDRLSDGENIDPIQQPNDGQHSEASSQPSEYPSTNHAWPEGDDGAGFDIHEDEN
ncbi:hypothetical protein PLIIFM63780_002446 [Purpureocillium lilacinum]|uniref:Uncharacterized protein n=1 Tax=Purpureocillium lilacinum TaxID=33203 RepID=A0A179G9U3_PURLI|nr:hypothetical protein VFPBJ_09882 [Purpureocillium lilacinum]GJN70963.1 hypothetical protein PLICBS_005023 [Purpureocillium lilacinum]GJN78935.1 hypothetical protein PLIIFM63780_002446 [Purpureocillium lilacinum]